MLAASSLFRLADSQSGFTAVQIFEDMSWIPPCFQTLHTLQGVLVILRQTHHLAVLPFNEVRR